MPLHLLSLLALQLLALAMLGAARVDDRSSLVKSFVALRSGSGGGGGGLFGFGGDGRKKGSVWYHTGCIRNPLTGSEVVSIQGIETVKPLSDSSYLSSKVFIYTDSLNDTSPIDFFRVRRQAPRRPVQPVRVLNEIVTLGALSRAHEQQSSSQSSSSTASQPGFYSQVEFSSGRRLHSRKIDLYDSRAGSPHSSSSSSSSARSLPTAGSARTPFGFARGLKMVHFINGVSAKRPWSPDDDNEKAKKKSTGETDRLTD